MRPIMTAALVDIGSRSGRHVSIATASNTTDASFHRPFARTADGENKEAARYGEILFEVEELIAIGELPVKQHRSEHAECRERQRNNPRQGAGGDQQTAAELEGNDRREQHAWDAELLHIRYSATIAADDTPTFMHKNEGQQQPASE